MDEEYKKALERVEILEKELARIKQAITALAKGQPSGGYMDFDREVFLEENEIKRESYVALAHMMGHLMEIKYCTYYIVRESLEKECEEYRETALMYTEWYRKVKDAYLITYLNGGLQDIYEYGITWYKLAAREQLDLQDMIGFLPEKCPWTLEELMENNIYVLTAKLPERERKSE